MRAEVTGSKRGATFSLLAYFFTPHGHFVDYWKENFWIDRFGTLEGRTPIFADQRDLKIPDLGAEHAMEGTFCPSLGNHEEITFGKTRCGPSGGSLLLQ
jgi:hypothetical protein